MTEKNRVWIELDKPRDPEHAAEICRLANNMLQRLNDGKIPQQEFTWSDRKAMYMYGNGMGYRYMSDRGEWFNLDYLGRPLEQS